MFNIPTKHTAVEGMASKKCLNTADNGQEDKTMSKNLPDLKTDVSNKSGHFQP